MESSYRSRAWAMLIGLASGGGVGLLLLTLWGGLEARSQDWLLSFRESPQQSADPRVVLVTISDATYEAIEEPRVFWGKRFARVLDRLHDLGASAIGIDLIPAVPVDRYAPELDEAFAAALMRTRGMVLIYQRVRLPDGSDRVLRAHDQLVTGLLLGGGSLGHNHVVPDPDQVIRRWVLADRIGEDVELSFPLALVAQAMGQEVELDQEQNILLGGRRLQSSNASEIRVNFRGPPGTYERIAFEDLAGEVSSLEPEMEALLAGAIVIVGSVSLADQDVHLAPTCSAATGELMPGIELHANVIDTILVDDGLLQPSSAWVVLIIALTVLAGAVVAALLPFWASLGVLLLMLSLGSLGVFEALKLRLLLPWVVPSISLAATFVGSWSKQAWSSARQKAEIRGLFERYVPKSVVETLIAHPELARLDGERRMVTIFFSDIRNFTTLSEPMDAKALSKLLNRYLTRMTRILMRNGATVDKYMGDGIMAIWGAPLESADGPERALRSAVEMMEALGSLREEWVSEGVVGAETFDIGVGIHTGEAFVGNIGSPERMEYTAIGDTVNLAARLEAANKRLGSNILISASTHSRVADLAIAGRVEQMAVKGRKERVLAYEILRLRETKAKEDS